VEQETLVVKASRLFDGTGQPCKDRGVIVIRDRTIQAVGVEGDLEVPSGPDVRVVSFEGSTALPGLIDVHTHLVLPGDNTAPEEMIKFDDGILLMQAAKNARRALFSGVTTMADVGARNQVSFTLRRGIAMGLAKGPRLVLSGRPLTRTGGHCWYFNGEADGPEAIRHTVRQLLKEGADIIKIFTTGGGSVGTDPYSPSYRLEEIEAATDEAHTAGKKTLAHCSATIGIQRALAAGIDVIFHAHFYEPGGRLNFRADVAQQMAESPVYVNPTLEVNRSQLEVLRARGNQLTPEERQRLDYRARFYGGSVENVSKLVKYGVKMVAGSDSGWGPNPFGSLVSEMELMVTAIGMSPPAVLSAATRNAADALGVKDQVGTLEVGKKADLLIVDGDPSSEIGMLRHIQAIVLDGQVIYLRAADCSQSQG